MRRGMTRVQMRVQMNEVSCRGCGNRWQYDDPLVLCRCPKCESLDNYYRNRPPQTKPTQRKRQAPIGFRPVAFLTIRPGRAILVSGINESVLAKITLP